MELLQRILQVIRFTQSLPVALFNNQNWGYMSRTSFITILQSFNYKYFLKYWLKFLIEFKKYEPPMHYILLHLVFSVFLSSIVYTHTTYLFSKFRIFYNLLKIIFFIFTAISITHIYHYIFFNYQYLIIIIFTSIKWVAVL